MIKFIQCKAKKNSIFSLGDCLECSKRNPLCDYTYSMIKSMTENRSLSEIHVTDITGSCTRQLILKDRIDYTVNLDDLFFALRGKGIHAVLENMNDDNNIMSELNVFGKLSNVKIYGRIDEVNLYNKSIIDYKTTSKIPASYPYKTHSLQVNIYKILFEKKYKQEINNLFIIYTDLVSVKKFSCSIMNKKELLEIMIKKIKEIKEDSERKFPEYRTFGWLCKYCPFEIQAYCKAIEISKLKKNKCNFDELLQDIKDNWEI